jgi:hypothetical protein
VTAHIRQRPGLWFRDTSAVSHAGSVRSGADPDPHIVELSKLMLARAPELGEALAESSQPATADGRIEPQPS